MNDNDTGAMNATDHHKETEMNDDYDLAAEYEALVQEATEEATPVQVTAEDITYAITSVMDDRWPYSSDVLDAIAGAVARQGTPLPRGAHLWIYGDGRPAKGERGADVVMIRTDSAYPEVTEVLSERGAWLRVSEEDTLRMP